jgi:regulatory protein YycH of two-component signal transduction system YycFG
MIHSNIDIDGEIYLTLKFEGDYKIEDYTIAGLLKGIKPKSIHIFVDTKPYEKKNNQQLLLDREKYNEEVYKNFKTIDDKLNNNISFWKNNYDSKKLGITFYDIIYFTIFLMSFVYTFKGLSYSWLYRIYFTIVPIVYLICGFIEV